MVYRLPPLSTLRVFEAASRLMSFKAAADELNLTPSAVSRGVQNLEQWLGVPLFHRANRSLAVTDAGAAYSVEVRKILDQLVKATDSLPGRGASGSISISSAPTFGLKWLMPRLSRFKARHPHVAITLDTTRRHVEFPRDAVDVAIRMGAGPWPGLEALHLVTEMLVPVCSAELAEQIRTVEDLAHVPRVYVTATAADWDYWARVRGVDLPKSPHELRFDTIQYAADAALQGLGVALGRLPVIASDLADGNLVPVLGPPIESPTSYWLVCGSSSPTRPEIRAFRAWITSEIEAGKSGLALPSATK